MKKIRSNWRRSIMRRSALRTMLVMLILNGICLISHGQNSSQMDSLTNLLADHEEEDTLRLNLLVELAKLNGKTNPDEGLKFGKQALSLSRRLGREEQKALAHYFIGQSYDHSDQYELAMTYYDTAVLAFEALQMKQYLAYCLAKMSVLHRNQGEFEEAMAAVKKASEINKERDDRVALGYNLDNLGTISNDLGQLDQAMDYFEQSLAIRKELKDTVTICESMLSISLVLMGHGQYDEVLDYSYKVLTNARHLQDTLLMAESTYLIGSVKALNYEFTEAIEDMEHALIMFEAIDAEFMITAALTVIGGCLAQLEDFEGAVTNFKKALSIAEEFNFRTDEALIFSNLASCYGEMEQYNEALDYGNKALELQEELGIQTAVLASLHTIASIYLKMKDYDQAIIYSNRALSLVEDEKRFHDLGLIHEIAYQAYQEKGNYKKAFEHLNNYMVAEDSLYNVEKSTEIANLTSVHDLKEQESENEVLRLNKALDEATITRQNYLIWGAALVIVILAALAFVIYRGLIQRRKMSINLSELNDQLNQSNEKLKTLNDYRTRLFANINHDFRTPLTLIKGYTDQIVVNKDNYLTQSSESDLKNLQKNTSILTQMTAEIQNLLLLEEGKLELTWGEIRLLPMLELVVNMFDSKVVQQKKSLVLNTEINDDLVFNADKLYFKKILFNLISNAIKHTENGDSITVTSSIDMDQIVIRVIDTGKGIDANHLPFIFDRFYQVPGQPYASQEGFGIGLSLVKELVTLHGGQISVESKAGEGTTFNVSLPFNADKVTGNAKNDPENEEEFTTSTNVPEQALSSYIPGQKEKTILIVDDHEEIRSYIGSILNEDYNLAFAGHGKQALEMLSINKIDLIITDLMMPWLDGFELIEQLSKDEQLKNIPVVVVSARTTEIDKQMILDAGVNDFITKPFEANDLRKRVSNRVNDTESIKSNAWQIIANNKDLTSNVEQSIIKKMNQLIIDRIDDPNLSVEDVASEISASRSKAFRLIKELTQKTPKAYIKDIRLEYVHELIKNGKIKNASEGARAIGMLNGTEFKSQYQVKFGTVSFE